MQEAAHHHDGEGGRQHGAEQGAQKIVGGHGRLLEGETGGDDGAEEVEAGALYREQAGTEGAEAAGLDEGGDAGHDQRHGDDIAGVGGREAEGVGDDEGGVMMATNMASICCRAANRVWGRAGHPLCHRPVRYGLAWGIGLSGCAYGGSLFHKYLECVGRGRKLGAILVIESGLTSANSGCNGFIF